MSELLLPEDPYALAALRAETSAVHGFSMQDEDITMLRELDGGAEELGFINSTYFITAGRSMIIPKSYEFDSPVTYTNFYGITFEGKFATYAKVHIGRIMGHHAVRAVCMAFTDALLLPDFLKVADDDLLYVPVLAVDSIKQTA